MKKEAIITVVSKQRDNEDEKIEVVTPGRFYQKDEKYYVVYDETEISGMAGTTTTIKIEKDQFTLKRKGTTNTRMIFKDKFNDFIMYQTPHGMLQLALNVKSVDIDVNECGGTLSAKYDMGVGGEEFIETEIAVNIKVK